MSNDHDEAVAMLVCNDTLSGDEDDDHHHTPSSSTATAPRPPRPVPGGNEQLLRQLQESAAAPTEAAAAPAPAEQASVVEQAKEPQDEAVAAVVVDDQDMEEPTTTAVPVVAASTVMEAPTKKKRKTKPSPDRLEAAMDARNALLASVPRLPVTVSDYVVRSFGQIRVEGVAAEETKYSNASAIYPVGYSCDRYEFSPVHGRDLKMRCTIFDGKKIKETQLKHGIEINPELPDGPVFRIMWGRGVDDMVDMTDYPYNVYSNSAFISDNEKVDTVALPVEADSAARPREPREGMRVKVRYENDVLYTGTIVRVGEEEVDWQRNTTWDIQIQYDDGTGEDTVFPDEDVTIFPPSEEDKATEEGIIELTEIQGKPVTTVIGSSPLQAWGKALVKLGLVDEIVLERGLQALASARVEGRQEAKEKMQEKKLQRQQARARYVQRQAEGDKAASPVPPTKSEEAAAQEEGQSKADDGEPKADGATKADTDGNAPDVKSALNEAKADIPTEGSTSQVTSVKKDTADQADISQTDGVKGAPQAEKLEDGNGALAVASAVVENTAETSHSAEVVENLDKTSEEDKEPPTESETTLRAEVASLQEELAKLQEEDREASVALADARIGTMGPFFVNPFQEIGRQHHSWLATIIRKEKSKMGSTGNKKKVVTATDLLERNDTFFNPDIEALVEGLPGSEFCPSYVFQVFRAGGAAAATRAWVHEARLRQEQERKKQLKSEGEAKVKESQLREKEIKRKRREDERDARKRQKMEELDQKKKARAEERMSRLNVQVDERLFKEACFQREKVVLVIAKNLGKDFANRRKAAEFVSAQAVLDDRISNRSISGDSLLRELPPLGRLYDEDVIRLWDFFISFGKAFLGWGYLTELPTLDSLQDAIDVLRDEGTRMTRSQSIDLLVKLAIALCQPLAVSLSKLLFASLIALNPALQKDFGAGFFREVGESTKAKDESEDSDSKSTVLLPVNKMTWQEIARVAFLSDALGEIGLSRQESAHLLRGYRSGGHPNSKESKRLRKSEEFAMALLRQELSQREPMDSTELEVMEEVKVRVPVPCRPSATSSDWVFYLHNVNSLETASVKHTKTNLRKAIETLEKTESKSKEVKSILSDLGKSLSLLENIDSSKELSSSDTQSLEKARKIAFRVLDRELGKRPSSDAVEKLVKKEAPGTAENAPEYGQSRSKFGRQRIGLLKTLSLPNKAYKQLLHKREEYMDEALRLKEEMNRTGEDDEEEDDDDEDEDDVGSNAKDSGKEDQPNDTKKPAEGDEDAKRGEDGKGSNAVKASEGNGKGEESGKADKGGEGQQHDSPSEKKRSAENGVGTTSEIVATVVENGEGAAETVATTETGQVGKITPYDDFCGDIPEAPELIRRCLAVLRTLCMSGPGEPFIYPVDPQTNPGYYENTLRPMCFREVGVRLRNAASLYSRQPSDSEFPSAGVDKNEEAIEAVVAQFGRNIRLIAQNSACYANAGPMIVSAGEELMRIFERLFLDWVLAPKDHLPGLESLDDDRCVEFHASDEDSLVLLCDGCEGKYNMSRLDPPLIEVPKGDWYCPRCMTGRCWSHLDPRIGKKVNSKRQEAEKGQDIANGSVGVVRKCLLGRADMEAATATLLYDVEFEDGWKETFTLAELDEALAATGQSVEPVRCVEAVAESPGYGLGVDRGVVNDLVPAQLNPRVADIAAQAAVSSSVFRDALAGSSALRLISPEEMTAEEWLRLLILLLMKCSSSEMMQGKASEMEAAAAEQMSKQLQEKNGKMNHVRDVLPSVSDDEDESMPEAKVDGVETAQDEASAKPVAEHNGPEEPVRPVQAESVAEVDSSAIVVDASAIEVVTDMEVDPAPTATAETTSNPAKPMDIDISSQDETAKAKRKAGLEAKAKRQKAREDSIAAFCIKNELRPTVAAFEEDVVSQVVDSSLSAKEVGLNLASCRCRGVVCDFCGLSDVALGSPLVRVPNSVEWNERMPHATRSRRTWLLAEMGGKKKSHAIVTLRIAGEIVSEKVGNDFFEEVPDGGMTEFLPRNEKGFQDELRFRDEADLPFVSGSLSAHECCALSAHDTRKDQAVREYEEKAAARVEWSNSASCGRSLSLGRDSMNRSYWQFSGDSSLFVCEDAFAKQAMPSKWHRFSEPEVIASLIFFLGKEDVVIELKRAFPAAARLLRNRKWAEILLKRRFPMNGKAIVEVPSAAISSVEAPEEGEKPVDEMEEDEDEPYEEQEEVLVESKDGKLLWNAVVVAVSRKKDGKVNGYKVHYKEWNSRYDEWVNPFRVVEPVQNNIEVQAELLEDVASNRNSIPPPLEKMIAKDFLHARNRARGSAIVPDFLDIAKVAPSASSDERNFGLLKAALLLVEASLPIGSIDNTENGPWRPSLTSEWRSIVRNAEGPSSLMRCIIHLEDNITPEWIEPRFTHLLACMPIRFKAINEASISSAALRIFLIDQGVKYGEVDKRRYEPSKGRKK